MPETKILPLNVGEVTTMLTIDKGTELRIFAGEHGELAEALAGVQASLASWATHPDRVEALYAKWVEEEGWQVCVVLKD